MAASYTLSRALTAQAEQCDFCPRGDITEPDKPVAIPGFEFLDSCGKVDSIVKDIFTSDAAECIQLQDLLGTYCGCPPPENACTLCPDGSPVPDEYLSKELPWLATAFGGTAPTCEFLEAYMTTNESGDEGCTSLQITSASCGCPALPDHCVYCPGETLQEEYSQKVLPFVGNPDLGVTGTCEIYWYTQYQISQDDIRCDHSSVLTFHCGCNDGILGSWGATTEEQQIAMLWIPRVVGSFSLIAASMVLRHTLTDQKKRASVYHQMVFMIAIFDIVTALVFIVGAAAVEEMNPETGLTHGIYGAYGNDTSCKASGFFYQLGMYISTNALLIVFESSLNWTSSSHCCLNRFYLCFFLRFPHSLFSFGYRLWVPRNKAKEASCLVVWPATSAWFRSSVRSTSFHSRIMESLPSRQQLFWQYDVEPSIVFVYSNSWSDHDYHCSPSDCLPQGPQTAQENERHSTSGIPG